MKTAIRMSATLMVMLAAVGCPNDAKTPTPTAATPSTPATPATPPAKATPPVTTAPPAATTPPTTTTPPTEPPPAATTPTAGAADDIVGVGPLESLKVYCADVRAKIPRKDCMAPEMGYACDCGRSPKDVVVGPSTIESLPKTGGLTKVKLLLETRSVGDDQKCTLMVERAESPGEGSYFVPELMPCGEAKIAHDTTLTTEVTDFRTAREGDTDVVWLAWTETRSNQDIDGTETHEATKYSTRCTVKASEARCSKPAKK